MRKTLFLALLVQIAIVSIANAAGPYGNIHVGNWKGGAFTDDGTGAFSHCAATTGYGNGVILVVGQNASNSWLLGFASPSFRLTKGRHGSDRCHLRRTIAGKAVRHRQLRHHGHRHPAAECRAHVPEGEPDGRGVGRRPF